MLLSKNPLISVIIPTYKRSEKLKRAIGSVLSQSYRNIEVLVVDDNDPESSYRKINEDLFTSYFFDDRIKLLKHTKNSGGAAARNTGIIHSRGELIAFLDDDDLFLPGKLEKQKNFLIKNRDFNAVYCGSKQNEVIIQPKIFGDLGRELLLFKTSIFTPTLMVYKNVLSELEGFNEDFRRHQDYELLLRFFSKGYKIGLVPEPLVALGTNEGENTLHGKALESLKAQFLTHFHEIIERYDKERPGYLAEIYSKNYSRVIIDYIARKNFQDANRVFFEQYKAFGWKFCQIFMGTGYSIIKKKVLGTR